MQIDVIQGCPVSSAGTLHQQLARKSHQAVRVSGSLDAGQLHTSTLHSKNKTSRSKVLSGNDLDKAAVLSTPSSNNTAPTLHPAEAGAHSLPRQNGYVSKHLDEDNHTVGWTFVFCAVIIILFAFASWQDSIGSNRKMEISQEKGKQVTKVSAHQILQQIRAFLFKHWVSFCILSQGCGTKSLLCKGNLCQGGVASWREWELRYPSSF